MRGTVQKIEMSQAHVLLDDGQVLHVPVTELGAGVRVSSVVDVRVGATLSSADAGDDSRQKLNDILSSRPE